MIRPINAFPSLGGPTPCSASYPLPAVVHLPRCCSPKSAGLSVRFIHLGDTRGGSPSRNCPDPKTSLWCAPWKSADQQSRPRRPIAERVAAPPALCVTLCFPGHRCGARYSAMSEVARGDQSPDPGVAVDIGRCGLREGKLTTPPAMLADAAWQWFPGSNDPEYAGVVEASRW